MTLDMTLKVTEFNQMCRCQKIRHTFNIKCHECICFRFNLVWASF